MKKKLSIFSVLIMLLFAAPFLWAAADATYQALVHMNGPDEQVIESGGKVTVLSGGIVDYESGALLKIAGTQITPTAAQFNFLAGATAGTPVASKAVIADSNTNLGAVKLTSMSLGTPGLETAVTATATELNKLASFTGTVSGVRYYFDGTTAAASNTLKSSTGLIHSGSAPVVTDTNVVVTGFSPAFTGTTTFDCVITADAPDPLNGVAWKVAKTTAASITISTTTNNPVSDTIHYQCIGY